MTYYIVIPCRHCDEAIFYGLCVTFLEHNGYPVINFDTAACSAFECQHCGAMNYTGELEIEATGGRDVEEAEEVDA